MQMQLIKDMPRSINDAVELARKLETAEQAQRRLCQERRDQDSSLSSHARVKGCVRGQTRGQTGPSDDGRTKSDREDSGFI